MDSAINVVFDVETTSLATDADIIQLSAIHDDDEFNIYIIPEDKISATASYITQLSMVRGRLFHKGKPVPAEEPKEAFQKFLAWLKAKEKQVVLLAHNAKCFDSKRIIYSLKKYDLLSYFQDCVIGFVDTLALFKKALPNREKYSQESLVADLLGVCYSAHNSLEDVRALQRLVSCKEVSRKYLIQSSFTTEFAVRSTKYCVQKKFNLQTLHPLVTTKVVSKGMAEKIAGSGLTFHHLQLSFQRGGQDGLTNILSEKINGKARVTKNRRIISQLSNFFNNNN
ncbi:uncharacterized protein LOC114971528 [Acropora millepora]|uniref:uncharacterized protein LOC114971528 n=1 Tax=Acropora millepora TaxID=45264 RepID=UPI001CF53E5F|nr:uncharacterized protein LOC114971528 [Acropora millepora]